MSAKPQIIEAEPGGVTPIEPGQAAGAVVIMPGAARDVTPFGLLSQALSSGKDVATLEKFMDLAERHERNQARRAFDAAIAAAKAEIPVIIKNREVDFTSTKGRTHYRHEDLAGIARIVDPILGKHGLSYRFKTTAELNAPVTVTCIVSHREGHSEENTLAAGRDDTGNKNSIQQIGSTITYLQRYTLKAALGLAATDDDDGRSAGDDNNALTEKQIAEMRKAIVAVAVPIDKVTAYAKVERLEDIPAAGFDKVMTAIRNWKPAKESAHADR